MQTSRTTYAASSRGHEVGIAGERKRVGDRPIMHEKVSDEVLTPIVFVPGFPACDIEFYMPPGTTLPPS